MKYLTLILLIISSTCFADKKLIIGGFSNHAQPRTNGREWNERHPAIGIEQNGVEATAYRNSVDKISFSLSRIITNGRGYGARLGVAWYDQPLPVMQFGYFADNYDITFGYVSTLAFKLEI